MTVTELIEELQKLPPRYQEATVLAFSDDDWYNGTLFTPVCDIEIESDYEILLRSF